MSTTRTDTRTAQLVFAPQPDLDSLLGNLSAIRFSNGHLWVAGDECNEVGGEKRNTIERLTWNADSGAFDGHVRYDLSEFLDLPDGPDAEIDLEGLAIGDGYLWMIGSHSAAMRLPKRDADKRVIDHADAIDRLRFKKNKPGPNRHLIARVPMLDDGLVKKTNGHTAAAVMFTDDGNLLTDALSTDAHIGPYVAAGIPSKANGFDVEGLEYIDGRLMIGLRGPVLLEYALMIEVEPKETNRKGVLGLKKIGPDGERYNKHFLHLHGRGVRDLTRDGDDLLVLAGPTMKLDAPAAVYRLRDAVHLPDAVLHEPVFERLLPFTGEVAEESREGDDGKGVARGTDHAEGLAIAELDGERQLVVIYDSPDGGRKSALPPSVTADLFDV
ncbi:MAG TPA: DUF3616 domain-containing protein [Gemmataceae bacterium]|nr:DUF3616 domain-containing protein [Gemmataceae bacterium]